MKKLLFLMLVLTSCHLLPSKKISSLSFDCASTKLGWSIARPDTSNAFLKKLREQYFLNDLIKNAASEQEKVLILMDWTWRQWEHHPTNQPSKPDAITILEEVKQGKRFRCVEGKVQEADFQRFMKFIPHYLFYFDAGFDMNVGMHPPQKINERVMLVPVGYKNPSVFQRKTPIDNVTYTNCLEDFYPQPFFIK